MFEVNNGVAKIDGTKGKYDNTVTNPSVRYGRNAVDNYYSYIEKPLTTEFLNPNFAEQAAPVLDFSGTAEAQQNNIEKLEKFTKENDNYLKQLPPLEFEYRYMPNIHKRGKLGNPDNAEGIDKNALLGAAYQEMGQKKEVEVQQLDAAFVPNSEYSTACIDLNNDGKIDVAEYGSTILAADMFSKSETPDLNNIDGTINSKGMNKILEYTKKSNAQAAADLYSKVYNQYQLNDAVKDFNPEN